ncbi:GreA/GreB family elongation factor [Streptomyces olivochromogenes]|uniref:GreA/GreB family elongation factor n=1 Tax=Streptomyces olivochromogenes TaxID=1963 RepID=UPI001F44D146|nr:GreA/GreB family elongation factor [Streptomyces olivochromogenes]MCF3132913.1 GreA/GreB family elongation factor [Streptomyces olivochromogenes]
MPSESAPISNDARRALERELADLHTERTAVAATLHSDTGVGDRADEADELQRVEELQRLDARISELTTRLRRADTAGPPPTDLVGVGSTVTVRFPDGTVETFQIGELAEELDPTLVTADSPLGRALLGHHAGDTVSYHAPAGNSTAVVVSLGESPGGIRRS